MKTNERLQNSFRTMSMGYIGEKGKRECEAENEAIRMAIAALEKQIHKRPKFDVQKNYVQGYEVEDTYVHCPVCGYRFYSIVNGEECAGRKTPFCPICGQKIDWEG